MTRSQKNRCEHLGEYYYIGHFLEGDLRDKLTVYRTKDYYFDSDDKRFEMGNYFKSLNDARDCLNEYDEAVKAFKEKKNTIYNGYGDEIFSAISNYASSYHIKTMALVKQISQNSSEIRKNEKGLLTAKRKDIRIAIAQLTDNPLGNVRL